MSKRWRRACPMGTVPPLRMRWSSTSARIFAIQRGGVPSGLSWRLTRTGSAISGTSPSRSARHYGGDAMLEGIARYLDDKGIVTFDPNGISGDIFMQTMPPQPRDAVALMSTGGDEPLVRHPFDTRRFQVLVRGGADPRPPLARAEAIYDALQGLAGRTLSDGTYVVAIGAVQAGPIRLGPDENGRHMFSLNFWMRVHVPTEYRKGV